MGLHGGDTEGTRQKVVIEVTHRTKKIANGIEARVIRDTVSEKGVPVEITDDWYAQDKQGNVWYLGEYVTNYENGKVVDHAGSFEAGVDGAQAGVALPANPRPGMSYRQEHYKGEAEDNAAVITVGEEQVEVPFGYFKKDVLMTRDLVPTESKVQELKFYAPGVGPLHAHRRPRRPRGAGQPHPGQVARGERHPAVLAGTLRAHVVISAELVGWIV